MDEFNIVFQDETISPEQIERAVGDYMRLHPIDTLTEREVQQIVADYMSAHPSEGVSEETVAEMVADYMNAHPMSTLSESDVEDIVEDYFNEHTTPHHTTEQINAIIASYMSAHPVSTLTESKVNALISAYMVAHPQESISQAQVEHIVDEYVQSLDIHGEKGDKGDTGAKGEKGDTGAQGIQGEKGAKGEKGADGKSAYEIAVSNGFSGTQAEWLASLKGEKGDKGDKGAKGDTGAKGDKGDKGDSVSTEEISAMIASYMEQHPNLTAQDVVDTINNMVFNTPFWFEHRENVKNYNANEPYLLEPNTFYVFGRMNTLDIAFNVPDNIYANHYHFAFNNGLTPCELTFEEELKGIPDNFEVKPNTYIEISILDGYLTYQEWEEPETEVG